MKTGLKLVLASLLPIAAFVALEFPGFGFEVFAMSHDDTQSDRLEKMRRLRRMNVGEKNFDETLRLVAQCPQMQRLDFWGTFDGEALKHLQGHQGIAELELGISGFKDETLEVLPTIPNLTKVILKSRSSFHDEALAYVRRCPKLEVLDLYSEHFTSKGYRELFHMETLRRLEVSNVKVPFPAFTDAKLPLLRKLVLRGEGVDDQLAASLNHLPALVDLSIAHSSITDKGFSQILRLKNLVDLGVDDMRITSASVQRLGELPKLESVFCRGVKVEEPAVAALCKMSSLKALYVFNSGLTPAEQARIKAALPDCDVEID